MSRPELWRRLRQAKLPILMAVVVAVLVVLALAADERRQCRQTCLQEGHPDYSYVREKLSGQRCDCITRDGRTVPPAQR
jgi:sensor domain CHASE-containing protein